MIMVKSELGFEEKGRNLNLSDCQRYANTGAEYSANAARPTRTLLLPTTTKNLLIFSKNQGVS